LGEKDHYSYFNTIDSLFHSEFGVDGMTAKSSMTQFLSDQHLGTYDMRSNIVWRHHGEWWDTKDRDETIFGPLDTLEDRITASQFLQSEGLRYALEANRRRAFHNSGSIIWQANEPYPNISCTSLIDYYLYPKPALTAVKSAFAKINPNLKYNALVYEEGDTLTCDVYITTDIPIDACTLTLDITNETTQNSLISKQYTVNYLSEGSHHQDTVSLTVPKGAEALKATLSLSTHDTTVDNHVLWLVRTNGYCGLKHVSSILKNNTNTNDIGKKRK
jgi:beta-mannosidase